MRDIERAQRATRWIFFICGLGLSSWAPMVPFVKENLDLNDASLGLVLLSLGAGAILMMPVSGWMVHRFGSRLVILLSAVIMSFLLPFLLLTKSVLVLGTVLFLFGAGVGSIDVAMNTQALKVQELKKKVIMSSLHGLYSVGGLAGSFGIGLLMKGGLPPFWAAIAIAVGILTVSLIQYKNLLPADAEQNLIRETVPKRARRTVTTLSWLKSRIIFLGSMCFIVFLAEGALLDWSAVYLREHLLVEEALTGAGYAAFSVAMAGMRLGGDAIVSKFNDRAVVIWGASISAMGFLLSVATPWLLVTLAGYVLVGVGAANIVPVFFSAAAQVKDIPKQVAVPVVTTMGYAGQLAGPAILGFIAYRFNLAMALGFNAILLIIVAVAYAVRK